MYLLLAVQLSVTVYMHVCVCVCVCFHRLVWQNPAGSKKARIWWHAVVRGSERINGDGSIGMSKLNFYYHTIRESESQGEKNKSFLFVSFFYGRAGVIVKFTNTRNAFVIISFGRWRVSSLHPNELCK